MGANLTKTSRTEVTKIVDHIVNEVVNDTARNITINDDVDQDIDIFVGGKMHNCTVSQTDNKRIKALAQLSSSESSEMVDELSKKIKSEVAQKIHQKNSGFNFGQVNTMLANSNVTDTIQTIVSSTVTTTVSEAIEVNSKTHQHLRLHVQGDIDCRGKAIAQKESSDTVTSMLASNISDKLMANQTMIDLQKEYQFLGEQSNVGLDPTTIAVIIVAIILVIMLLFR